MTRATDGKPGAKHLGLDLSLTAIAVPSLLFSLDSVSQSNTPRDAETEQVHSHRVSASFLGKFIECSDTRDGCRPPVM